MKKYPEKKYPTIGVCGLDCGLCPRYYTSGPSRCPGCAGPDFFNKHPSCSFITCCVSKRDLEVCAECPDFPCPKFKGDEEYQQLKESASYPSYKKVISNLNFIKEHGVEKFIEKQNERIKLLEMMLEAFDDGRSKSFYCRSAGILDIPFLESAVESAVREVKDKNVEYDDLRAKAKILRRILSEVSPAKRKTY